jgi:hypothetical protein
MSDIKETIERVIDKRHARGASDASIIGYLTGLKRVWKSAQMHHYLNALIAGVEASPATAK